MTNPGDIYTNSRTQAEKAQINAVIIAALADPKSGMFEAFKKSVHTLSKSGIEVAKQEAGRNPDYNRLNVRISVIQEAAFQQTLDQMRDLLAAEFAPGAKKPLPKLDVPKDAYNIINDQRVILRDIRDAMLGVHRGYSGLNYHHTADPNEALKTAVQAADKAKEILGKEHYQSLPKQEKPYDGLPQKVAALTSLSECMASQTGVTLGTGGTQALPGKPAAPTNCVAR